VGYARQDVAELESAATTPNLAPLAATLTAEALNMGRRHLASLESLAPRNPVV